MTGERTYVAIDLKSFYASVECRERGLDPLTAKLVVADSSRTSKTICLAVTPALKAYGLSGRSRLFEVEAKAREIKRQTGKELEYITAPPRMALYMEVSARIYSIYLEYFSPEDIHVYSIDEVFIDVTSYLHLYKTDARSLAVKVIKHILRETGITATCGIAPNLYLCKIAMDIEAKHIKPDEDGGPEEKPWSDYVHWLISPISDVYYEVIDYIKEHKPYFETKTLKENEEYIVEDKSWIFEYEGRNDYEFIVQYFADEELTSPIEPGSAIKNKNKTIYIKFVYFTTVFYLKRKDSLGIKRYYELHQLL